MMKPGRFKVENEQPPGILRGHFTRMPTPDDHEIRTGRPGFLRSGPSWLQGFWKLEGNVWVFNVLDNPTTPLPQVEYEVFDHYWGERARLALDETIVWNNATISEHDHCAICWKSLGDGGVTECHRSDCGDVVCPECFTIYVRHRSLDFIKPAIRRPSNG